MKKILIVDDRIEIRELVGVTLRSDDYRVIHAENGEKAVEIARAEKPDLIIFDPPYFSKKAAGLLLLMQIGGISKISRQQPRCVMILS